MADEQATVKHLNERMQAALHIMAVHLYSYQQSERSGALQLHLEIHKGEIIQEGFTIKLEEKVL